MKAQDLKNSILQLAMQGKLVEQCVKEGTAKELLESIEIEKKLLIKAGKIKQQKALSVIRKDEIPFDIPESWEWVRLDQITHNWGQKKPNNIFEYIDVGSIDNINGVLSENENLIEPKNAPSRARKIIKEGTVLYSTVRPYLLNICVIDKQFKHEPIASTAFAILHPYSGINNVYLYNILRSPMFVSYVNSVMIGVAYPAINEANLLKGLIPIPPLEEQKRIVAKIEELKPYVDKYNVAYSEVVLLNKKFPEDIQKSILQYAIQGKLVEQREEDGTAYDLYKQIQDEKKKLIMKGKIKKTMALPEISEDEIPFDIPENWKWVRLGEITHNWGQKKPDKTFDYIDVGSIDNINALLSGEENLIEPSDAPSRARKIVKEGSVLYSTVRPYLLNLCIINTEFKHEPIASTAFAILHPIEGLYNKYLYFILKSPVFISYVSSVMIGVAYPAINDTNLLAGLIPLPPLNEQKRIVKKIEELLPYAKQIIR